MSKNRKCSKKMSKQMQKFKQNMKRMGLDNKINMKVARPHLKEKTKQEIETWYQPKGNKLVSNLVTDFMSWGNYRIPYMIYRDLNENYVPNLERLRKEAAGVMS